MDDGRANSYAMGRADAKKRAQRAFAGRAKLGGKPKQFAVQFGNSLATVGFIELCKVAGDDRSQR